MSPNVSFFGVDADVDRFQFFITDGPTDMYFDGRPLCEVWVPPLLISYKPMLPEPDFWDVGLGELGRAWAIRPEAFEAAPELAALLSYSGELLPLPYGDRTFQVFNITECIAALDTERTVWEHYSDGSIAGVESPAFRLDLLGHNLFKLPETASERIYYWENGGLDIAFRSLVEHAGLTGLTFQPL